MNGQVSDVGRTVEQWTCALLPLPLPSLEKYGELGYMSVAMLMRFPRRVRRRCAGGIGACE
ncbi:unnamed protein product [Ceratitis capitata]|uniref:(Mediterranean fruit fly) hypothetical protein n=1 Tax=Ceratitis capitata TaxID=7213 RepID=A0A811UBA3_CERCA|nr:unnamed protein product [Ceratitis capitata]